MDSNLSVFLCSSQVMTLYVVGTLQMLAQVWGQGTDQVMKRNGFNINMYIYSLVLFIQVFLKCVSVLVEW